MEKDRRQLVVGEGREPGADSETRWGDCLTVRPSSSDIHPALLRLRLLRRASGLERGPSALLPVVRPALTPVRAQPRLVGVYLRTPEEER